MGNLKSVSPILFAVCVLAALVHEPLFAAPAAGPSCSLQFKDVQIARGRRIGSAQGDQSYEVYHLGAGRMGGLVRRYVSQDSKESFVVKTFHESSFFDNDVRALNVLKTAFSKPIPGFRLVKRLSSKLIDGMTFENENGETQILDSSTSLVFEDVRGETLQSFLLRAQPSEIRKVNDFLLKAYDQLAPKIDAQVRNLHFSRSRLQLKENSNESVYTLRVQRVNSLDPFNIWIKPDNILVTPDGELVLIDPF